MSKTITYSECPSCKSTAIAPVLYAEDFTVSQEKFAIWHCNNCTLRFTQDVPVADEIGKYYQSSAYISHSDTKQGLINRLYHFVRNYTLQSKKKLINKSAKNAKGSLLDIGAGTGAFANTMQHAGWHVTSLEPDETARQNAFANYNLQLQSPVNLDEFEKEIFDVITLWHVLEHVHDLHKYLETFYKILKQDGILIIAVPNYTAKEAEVYAEYWAAYDVPRHLYHFSPAGMEKLVQQYNFFVDDFKPMWFDSFYVSMLSEKYKTGNNHLLKALWNGLLSNIKALSDVKLCSSVIYIIRKN